MVFGFGTSGGFTRIPSVRAQHGKVCAPFRSGWSWRWKTPVVVRTATTMRAAAGTASDPYRIAVLDGDGIGPEMASLAIRILSAVEDYTDLHFDIERLDFGQPSVDKFGASLAPETIEKCKKADAVLKSYQGDSKDLPSRDNPHVQLRNELDMFAQLLPVRVYPQLVDLSVFQKDKLLDMDVLLIREISGGFLGDRKGDLYEVTDDQHEMESFMRYEKDQVDRFAELVLNLAQQRGGSVVNVDRADVLSVSRFWRKTLHSKMHEILGDRRDIVMEDMLCDDFCRAVVNNPKKYDVICTSNLFGDVIAEVLVSIAGPARLSPTSWFSASGLSVHGPADMYNASAYLESSVSKFTRGPISMIRATSMLLRYGLDEPAAADLVEKAFMQTIDANVTPRLAQMLAPGELGDRSAVSAEEFTNRLIASLEFMHQFEMVCDPVECGE